MSGSIFHINIREREGGVGSRLGINVPEQSVCGK